MPYFNLSEKRNGALGTRIWKHEKFKVKIYFNRTIVANYLNFVFQFIKNTEWHSRYTYSRWFKMTLNAIWTDLKSDTEGNFFCSSSLNLLLSKFLQQRQNMLMRAYNFNKIKITRSFMLRQLKPTLNAHEKSIPLHLFNWCFHSNYPERCFK